MTTSHFSHESRRQIPVVETRAPEPTPRVGFTGGRLWLWENLSIPSWSHWMDYGDEMAAKLTCQELQRIMVFYIFI